MVTVYNTVHFFLLLYRHKLADIRVCCCGAGGVAMGSSAALHLSPGGAVAVGLFAGLLSTTGFGWLVSLATSVFFIHKTLL
jgi:hypothetical protein